MLNNGKGYPVSRRSHRATGRAICADGAHSSRPNPCLCKRCGVVPFIRMEKNATTAGRGRGARNVPVLTWTEGAGGRGGRKKNGGCGKRRTVEIILQASGRLWKRRAGVETESPRGFKPKVRAYDMQIGAAYGMAGRGPGGRIPHHAGRATAAARAVPCSVP